MKRQKPDCMRLSVLACALLVCLVCGCGHGLASRGDTLAGIMSFTDEEFFGMDESVLAPRESRLLDTSFLGVAVSAPRKIDTSSRDRLPLVMAVRSGGERGWDVRLKENCILVGTDLSDGSVHFAKAFADEKKSRGSKEKRPKGPRPAGLALATAQLTGLDAKERLKMKWDTGTWALGVINYDWASNTVVVDLVGDKEARVQPAGPVSPEPSPLGAGGLPCYLATAHTPPSPESGVVFTAEFTGKQGDRHMKISGAFTIPVRDAHVPKQKVVHKFRDGRQENVVAVVPVTLAVVGLDWGKPLKFDWAVPVYGSPLNTGMPAKGFFALNAFASGSAVVLDPGKYACYLVVDGRIYGPDTIEVPGPAAAVRQ